MEPLPPVKEVEYRCVIGKGFDEILGREYTTFSFETAKEFSSFRYEIAVRYRVEPGNIVFRVLGMTATRMMMPSFGTAKSVLKVPFLAPGVYAVTFIKSDGNENVFSIEVTKKGIQILKPIPRKRFIDVIVLKDTASPGAKIASTVSKAPTMPLVPRTIQKRQPTPPTPEELEILEALKSETPEERDRREEMELFGGKKRLSKKDLAAEERELKKLGDKNEKSKGKDKKNAGHKAKAKPAKKAAPKKVKSPSKTAKAKPAKSKKGKKR